MRKLDINEKKSRIKNKHGHILSFEKTDFASSIRSYKKTTFICLKHRYEFQNTLKNILRVNVPCRYCRDEEKINKCLDAHGDKFDYSKTNSKFSEAKLNTIVCKKHGQFKINLKDHIRYNSGGCKDCYRDNSSKRQRMDIAKYIIKANKIHNNKYDYSYLHQFKNQHY